MGGIARDSSREAKASIDRYCNALATWSMVLNSIAPEGAQGGAMLALMRQAITKIDVLARESDELTILVREGIDARPHYVESRASQVLEVNAALQQLRLAVDKANEAKEGFKNRDSMGEFTINIEQAKTFRDMQKRLNSLLGKRLAPIANGRLTPAEIVEEGELSTLIIKTADSFACPADYTSKQAMEDSNRLHQLNCKRISPRGSLSNAEDEEEALLSVRVAAYQRSPEGRYRKRINELTFKSFGKGCNADEQEELDRLTSLFPVQKSEGDTAKGISDFLQKHKRDSQGRWAAK